MNLHGIVRGAISSINPDVSVTVLLSTGYTIAPDGTQVPAYGSPVAAMAQVQALTAADVKQLDSLNIQEADRTAYLQGDWRGLMRKQKKGSDIIRIGQEEWLVVGVLEAWPDWSKVAICLQQLA